MNLFEIVALSFGICLLNVFARVGEKPFLVTSSLYLLYAVFSTKTKIRNARV